MIYSNQFGLLHCIILEFGYIIDFKERFDEQIYL